MSREIGAIPQSILQHTVDSSLTSFLDQQVCVHTFDNTLFVGELAAFDQPNGVTLLNARKRYYCQKKFHEEDIGTVYLTGMNVMMIATRDDTYLNKCEEVSLEEIKEELKKQKDNISPAQLD